MSESTFFEIASKMEEAVERQTGPKSRKAAKASEGSESSSSSSGSSSESRRNKRSKVRFGDLPDLPQFVPANKAEVEEMEVDNDGAVVDRDFILVDDVEYSDLEDDIDEDDISLASEDEDVDEEGDSEEEDVGDGKEDGTPGGKRKRKRRTKRKSKRIRSERNAIRRLERRMEKGGADAGDITKAVEDKRLKSSSRAEKKSILKRIYPGIKLPRSAFVFFINENYTKVSASLGEGADHAAITKKLGEMWKALEDKTKFETMATEDKARFERDVEASGNSFVPVDCISKSRRGGFTIKATKVPGAPGSGRRAKTPFIHFMMKKRSDVATVNPSLSNQEVLRKLGEMWRGMADADKAPYVAMYNAERNATASA